MATSGPSRIAVVTPASAISRPGRKMESTATAAASAGGEREAEPRRERAYASGPMQSDEEADLRAGGAREGLAERDEAAVLLGAEPSEPPDISALEIAQMRDRTAEGSQSEVERGLEHLRCASQCPRVSLHEAPYLKQLKQR